MAKNGLNKELDFIVPDLKQRRTVPEKRRIHPQKWSRDLPGYRIGIPIVIALRK